MIMQKTVRKNVYFSGLGVHSGEFSRICISPADADSGIRFVHSSFAQEPLIIGSTIPLQAMHATVLPQQSWSLSTVEHLVAALRMLGIDNVTVYVESSEIPILDGSAALFLHEFRRIGLVDQGLRRKFIMPRQSLIFEEQGGKKINLVPPDDQMYGVLQCDYESKFDHFLLNKKTISRTIDLEFFYNQIAPARTFGFIEQLPILRKHKLAAASSLGNTLVFGADEVINDLRFADEWTNHKILDFIGDLGLLPYMFTGYIKAAQTGHAFNRCIVQHYLSFPEAWVIV